MPDKILSEIDKDLTNHFRLASRMSCTSPQSEELGKFVVAFFLDELGELGCLKPSERESHRNVIKERLIKLNLLTVGADCLYKSHFGHVASLDNFLFANYMTSRLAKSPQPLTGSYHLIVAESFASKVPNQNVLNNFLKSAQEEQFPREEHYMDYYDTLKPKQETLSVLMYCLSHSPKTILKLGNKENRIILRALYDLETKNYVQELLETYLKPGGILIDRSRTSLSPMELPWEIAWAEALGVIPRRNSPKGDNLYGPNMKVLDINKTCYSTSLILKKDTAPYKKEISP